MDTRAVNQFGDKSIYIERNVGNIYMGDYVAETIYALRDGSYEMAKYSPTISPAIHRIEVDLIKDWIDGDSTLEPSSRLALLYGKAGVGKSVVMHDLLEALQNNDDYLVFGLKSDQVEFIDTDDLSKKMHLAKPIEVVVEEMAQKYKRIVLLVDQIDALSLSLSSNRTPLRSLIKLIEKISAVGNVRIVISCRPYDLEYDPLFDRLNIKNKWELKDFTKDEVINILNENNCKEHINEHLLQFLGNPLNLYLFLKVNPNEQLTDPLSTDVLYHQLWKKYIIDDSERKVEKTQLLSLLDILVSSMYKRQELSVHIREYETGYDKELKYLFSNGILLLTRSGQIQFFHQTLFDYVYARRFTELGFNLLDELKAHHQGLFSRAAVKSILSFLREKRPWEYKEDIDKLLYAKDDNGNDTYRFHMKSLALSNMAYFESPIQEEINLISNRVFADKVYMDVVFETVHTTNWFKAIWGIINKKGGWSELSVEYKDKVMVMCQRTLWSDAKTVLDTLEQSLDYNNEADCKYLGCLLQRYELNCDSKQLIAFYNKIVKTRNPLEHIHLLRNILKGDPSFVCNELKENVKLQLAEKNTSGIYRVNISHDVEFIYSELLKRHHALAIQLFVEILELIYEATQYHVEDSDLVHSYEFFSFQRKTGGHLVSNFAEDVVNIIIDGLLKDVENDETKRYLDGFSKSKYGGFVFIALYIYTSYPAIFHNEAFELIVNRTVLSNAPSWVEYQAVEALKATCPYMEDKQKIIIIDKILSIKDRGENILFDKDTIGRRLQYGHPILDIDLHKGKALEVIPQYELKKYSWKAYQERLRIDRKFKEKRLRNEKPSSFSVHVGWSSLNKEQGKKMSCNTWLKSMLKYNTNPYDHNKPSLTGQCQLFRTVVAEDPDKFIALIDTIIADKRILLAYPEAGMQGLLDVGRMKEATHVLRGILGAVNNDVNSTERGFDIHSLLFALSDTVKGDNVPDVVFQLLCNALINVKEPTDDRHRDTKDVCTVGINQSRGNAGFMLVQCAKHYKYKEDIFKTIESIAESSSVYTRAAILFNMASLNYLDKDRNVKLFKKLMHDYNARLMSMPVHNYNPLVYFVNYAVDELMDFFNHAADCPECYDAQVIILWLAWSHNNHDARIKVLLDKMCDTSQAARLSLLKFFGTLRHEADDDVVEYILRYMDDKYDSPEMGEACDDLFDDMDSWPDEIQTSIAKAFVESSLSSYKTSCFIEFLAGYAIKNPVQTLTWLEQIMKKNIPDDYYVWNNIIDVIIQSYNGIKSFNDNSYQDVLEHAMDLIDNTMQNPSNKYLISNFINKLDNE